MDLRIDVPDGHVDGEEDGEGCDDEPDGDEDEKEGAAKDEKEGKGYVCFNLEPPMPNASFSCSAESESDDERLFACGDVD